MTNGLKHILFVMVSMFVFHTNASAFTGWDSKDSLVMKKLFSYQDSLRDDINGLSMNVYTRFRVYTEKKNKLLLTVPSMYSLARRKNIHYAGETYSKLTFTDVDQYELKKQLSVGTIPRYKNVFPTITEMFTPDLYEVTIFNDHILSPFNRTNMILYRYGITRFSDNRVEVVFRPRKYNTQLIAGKAIVDEHTGRIISVDFFGEYDMIRFEVNAVMNKEGPLSLLPNSLDVNATFNYLGNKINGSHHVEYNLPLSLPDTIENSHDLALMEKVRPTLLPAYEERMYYLQDSINRARDSVRIPNKKSPLWRRILWDSIGSNILNRIKGNFGNNDQGYFRLSPIFNPLYLGYNPKRGFTYKSKIRANYRFTAEKEIALNARLGYTFKYHQFYFRLPVRYTFRESKHGYVEVEVGNGNRIYNSSIIDKMKEEGIDSVTWMKDNLDYFKDMYTKMFANYDLSEKLSIGGGFTFHRRTAVDRKVFDEVNKPSAYHSLAPKVETQFRPWGWKGPIFTVYYEQGIKGLGKSDMNYGRLESDAIWQLRFPRLRSLSMRLGGGAYTMKDKNCYFLDYENFREDNMPGGWNDDWTGEFQLLSRTYYNYSDFYVRANMTYESPLMLISRIPIVGKIIEMERIYVSYLVAKSLYPYSEWGYGFTNRLFSIGLFVATKNMKYDGFGCRIGFELFRDW